MAILYQIEKSLSRLLKVFIMNRHLILSNAFSVSIDINNDYVIFLFLAC